MTFEESYKELCDLCPDYYREDIRWSEDPRGWVRTLPPNDRGEPQLLNIHPDIAHMAIAWHVRKTLYDRDQYPYTETNPDGMLRTALSYERAMAP